MTKLVAHILLMIAILALEPTKYAVAQQVFWVFNHGIRVSGTAFNGVREGLGLCGVNYCPSVNASSMSLSYSTQTQTIARQATDLAGDINTYRPSDTSKIILVGHSEGGLRARQYLQQTGLNSVYRTSRNQVRGLAVIGTPNYGAPVTNNGPGLVSYGLSSLAAVLTFGFWLPGAYAALQPPIQGFSQYLVDSYTGAGVNEMRPSSTFLNRLNNAPYQSCRWQSYTHTHYVLWWSYQETHYYKVCTPTNYPGFHAVPANVSTMSIVGGNNNLDGWLRDNGPQALDRNLWATASTTIAAVLWGLAFWTFGATIPAALAFTNLAVFLWALPSLWNQAVGSPRNDILIPEYSQNLYHRDRGLGGSYKAFRYLPTAFHDGAGPNTELKIADTVRALTELKTRVLNNP